MRVLEKYSAITGAERQAVAAELVLRYRCGATLRELATLTGRSATFVRRLLLDSGVVLRSRGGRRRGAYAAAAARVRAAMNSDPGAP